MALQDYVETEWVNDTAPAINSTNLLNIEKAMTRVTVATQANEDKFPVKDVNLASATELVKGGAKMWLDGTVLNISTI